MKVLVTGANGLVGSCLVPRLGPEAVAVTREQVNGYEPAALAALIGRERPAQVIHCAALTDVDACEREPDAAWRLNVDLVAAAARACAAAGARFVALSTDYVFDGERGPYSEDDAPNPRGVYARTKRAGEEAALLLAPDSVVCRVAVVYSGKPGAKRTFATGVVESLRRGQPVKAFHDQLVSPTLADNAAEMVIGVARSGVRGIVHCTGASIVSRVEFARALARRLGADEALVVPVALAELKLPAPRPLRCGLRVEKVQALLGAGAPLPLDAALDRFLAESA